MNYQNLDLTTQTPLGFISWKPEERLALYNKKLGALRKKWLEYPLKRGIVKKQANYIKAAIQKLKKEHKELEKSGGEKEKLTSEDMEKAFS